MSRTEDYCGSKLDKQIDDAYMVQYSARIAVGIVIGASAVIGLLAGLGFSFTALSPSVVGGVIGFIPLALLTIGLCFFFRGEINELRKEMGVTEKGIISALTPPFLLATIMSVATGVYIATATSDILPGIFATWWAMAVGAGIGAIALPTGIVTGVTAVAVFAGSLYESIIPDKCVIGQTA